MPAPPHSLISPHQGGPALALLGIHGDYVIRFNGPTRPLKTSTRDFLKIILKNL